MSERRLTLAAARPDLAAELVHPEIALSLTRRSHTKVLWRCVTDSRHAPWWAVVSARTRPRGSGCPVCSNRVVQQGVNDMATTHPDLAAQLVDPAVGTRLTAGSNTSVEWRCLADNRHPTWHASPNSRSAAPESRCRGCRACQGRLVVAGVNDLWTVRPDVAASLCDPEIGYQVTARSNKRVEWKCLVDERHATWTAVIANRTAPNGTGCRVCGGRCVQAGLNDLATTSPRLASELVDPALAVILMDRSDRIVQWRCTSDADHVWSTSPSNRTLGRGCPHCARSGYKPTLPAYLYVVYAEDLQGAGPASQLGITNDPASRLAKHFARGFHQLLALWRFDTGRDAALVEGAAKRILARDGVATCALRGLKFDGSTESYLHTDLDVHALLETLAQVVEGLPRTVAPYRADVDREQGESAARYLRRLGSITSKGVIAA